LETDRFTKAIGDFDAANGQDPQSAHWKDLEGPRELLFARCVYQWVTQLDNEASEPLLLAARAHTLCRWEVPRSRYAMNRQGYHQWRDACAEHHAQVAEKILREKGYDNAALIQVLALILKKNWPTDPEARTLEDADCLAFLEMKLASYVDEWEAQKAINILRRTLRKMTPKARNLATSLVLDPRAAELLQALTCCRQPKERRLRARQLRTRNAFPQKLVV
jgi:hypothetical protein